MRPILRRRSTQRARAVPSDPLAVCLLGSVAVGLLVGALGVAVLLALLAVPHRDHKGPPKGTDDA